MDDDRNGSNNREYSNGEITVFWKPLKCIHATTCYTELIDVFNPRKRPWVNMQGASTEEIIRVVKLCPTEALSYKYNENSASEIPISDKQNTQQQTISGEPETEVKIMKNGPLVVKGKFIIVGSMGGKLKHMNVVSFCRCGQSQKMPFCDGTHRNIGFKAD